MLYCCTEMATNDHNDNNNRINRKKGSDRPEAVRRGAKEHEKDEGEERRVKMDRGA